MSINITNIFSLGFEGIIWKILPEPDERGLILELRNPSAYQVAFARVDWKQGQVRWKVSCPEPWWVQLWGVSEQGIVLGEFSQEDRPQSEGIMVLKPENGALAWRVSGLQIRDLTKEALIASNHDQNTISYFQLDWETGKVIEQMSKYISEKAVDFARGMIFPEFYPEESPYFDRFYRFFKKKYQIEILNGLSYYEHPQVIVISYFYKKNSNIANNLLILGHEGQVFLNQDLSDQVSGISPDTFFLWHDHIFFIQNKTVLIAYQIQNL